MDVIQWRKEREQLLDRVYYLEGGGSGRARDENVVMEGIARLHQRIAELDARIEADSGC